MENSITRLHKRLQIIVLSLGEGGGRDNHSAGCLRIAGDTLETLRETRTDAAAQLFLQKRARQQRSDRLACLGGCRHSVSKPRPRGHPVGPWELPSMLNQTVITDKSGSARALRRAPELHHEGPDVAFRFQRAATASRMRVFNNPKLPVFSPSCETFCTSGDIYPTSAFCLCRAARRLPALAGANVGFCLLFFFSTENSCLTPLFLTLENRE